MTPLVPFSNEAPAAPAAGVVHHVAPATDRLLLRALQGLRRPGGTDGERAEAQRPALVGDLLAPLGDRSAPLAAALLALPFVQPLSLGPLTTAASLAIALLGFHMLRGKDSLPLPPRLLQTSIPGAVLSVMRNVTARLLRWKRRQAPAPEVKPGSRLRNPAFVGFLILVGSALLAVPVPLLPLTNTFPALGIVLTALGWCEQNRRLTMYGLGSYAVGAVMIAGVFAALAFGLVEGAHLLGIGNDAAVNASAAGAGVSGADGATTPTAAQSAAPAPAR